MKLTINDAPESAAIAAHSDEYPANVRTTNTYFTASEKATFSRITAIVWRHA